MKATQSKIIFILGIFLLTPWIAIHAIGPFNLNPEKANIVEMNINGLTVILKHSTNEVVSANLYIRGGTANYSKEQGGIEEVCLSLVVDGGTKNYPKDLFHTTGEKLGTSIVSSTSYDYGSISMICVLKNWDESWKLYSDAILYPLMDEDEFNLTLEQAVASVKQSEGNPDAYLRDLSMQSIFKGKNYATNPQGTVESLKGLKLNDVTEYYGMIMAMSNLVLVVVGDIEKADLEEKVMSSLAQLPEGTLKKPVMKTLSIDKSSIQSEERDIATNYIRGIMGAPARGTKENIAMQVCMAIMRDRLFEEIRTKRGLSYSPQAFLTSLNTPYAVIYVTTTDPDSAVQVMIDEVKSVKKDGFTADELRDKKAKFLTQYYMGQETNSFQARALGVAELQFGWERTLTLVEEVNGLTLKDINTTFNKYVKAISWTYLGNESQITKDIYLQKLN